MGQVWKSEAGWIRAEQELQRSCYSPTVPSDKIQEELGGQCWPWNKKVYINQANYAFISQDRLSMMGSVLFISSLGQNDKTMVLSKYKCLYSLLSSNLTNSERSNSLLSSNLTKFTRSLWSHLSDVCPWRDKLLNFYMFLSTTVPTTIGYCKDYLKKDM